ncbi:hypothetical protein PInf_007007 [Phytophthora infestans]|nr:hypothetical protein PInf_007007 [Phytophthora infestans]
MPARGNKAVKPAGRKRFRLANGASQPGSPEDSTAKFRNKILGLSAVAEQNSAVPSFDEHGNGVEQKDIVTQMNEELARRQETYVRRERQYKVRINELEALLSDSRAKKSKENTLDASMDRVRSMHRSILDSVDQVQDRTSKILQGKFEELESEKNKTDDGASAWIEKSKQLETEVEWTKELADRLDRLNQSLTRENQRLKTQFSTQENDREFLVKQLVTVKKDNVSLRTELEGLRQQLDQLRESGQPQQQQNHHHSQSQALFATASASSLPKVHYRDSATSLAMAQRPNTAGVTTLTMASDSDNRYKEIIKRLKRLLEVERRNLQQVRTAYKLELQNHTELEMVIKECVQDIRGEIVHVSQLPLVMPSHSSGSLLGSPQHGRQSERRMSSSERQRLVEKLLEKEQLLNLLTTKAFPVRNGKRRGDPIITGEAVSPDEVARLLSDVSNYSDGRERQ